ncbi:hypothetical protein G15_2046 [Enterococcus avium]|uniref:DUF2513 domain-containing protein n=1 Tax=Enterococcus hailinensis TaxID=3238988 RepID=UPI00159A28C5|nr:hypothetical protein G15_2046 [Enterococcus avium]
MKLNQECVRDLLLAVEEQLRLEPVGIDQLIDQSDLYLRVDDQYKYELEELIYTAQKLNEAGFINGDSSIGYDQFTDFTVESITWNGHKFLDTVRDNKVWSDTKKITSKFSSVSLSLVENVASTVISQIISKYLHLD